MTTFTFQGSDGIDTYIQDSAPTTNFGTNTALKIGEFNGGSLIDRTLIKFDLSSIPSNAVVASATLSLWVAADFSDNTRTIRAYRQKRAWVEAEATWNVYSSGNSWQTAGGFGSNDCEQTDIGSVSVDAATSVGTEIQISLTASSVQDWIDGGFTNNGLLIKADTESDDLFEYDSSDSASSSERPKIVIVYYTLAGTLAVTGVGTAAATANTYPLFSTNVAKATFNTKASQD